MMKSLLFVEIVILVKIVVNVKMKMMMSKIFYKAWNVLLITLMILLLIVLQSRFSTVRGPDLVEKVNYQSDELQDKIKEILNASIESRKLP